MMKINTFWQCWNLFLISTTRTLGAVQIAAKKGCGISGVQYVVREDEDMLLEGSLVTKNCRKGLDPCPDEEYATGGGWETSYYYLRTGLPNGLHLVASCENNKYQTVRIDNYAYDATWYGVAVTG